MKNLILILSVSCIQFIAFSQPGKGTGDGIISGKILDKTKDAPLEYVSFRLFSIKDSSIIAGIFTDLEGKFILENLPIGNYYAKITFTGYAPLIMNDIKISAVMKVVNLGTIKMELGDSKMLQEVKIVGEIDLLKIGIDKKIYNVGEDLSVKGGTANDVLNNIPSVQVDQEGKISLRGDGGVTILIDGRPSSLSGASGKSLLDALPAGSIERIEIVTNPSAKYDPDGTSGIINIVLKKNKLKGFNGLVNGTLGSGDLTGGNSFEGGVSLSYRNSKFNTFGSYAGRYTEGYRNNYSDLTQTFTDGSSSRILQERIGTDLNAGHTIRLGSDFYLKARHLLGISSTASIGRRDRTGSQWNSSYDGTGTQLALWNRYSSDPSQQQNLDVNVNYKFDLKEDRGNLIMDFNQSLGKDDIQGFYDQNYYTIDSVLLGAQPIQQQLFNKERNNVTTGQVDFMYTFPKIKARIETGTKAILRHQSVNTYSESYDTLQSAYFQDTLSNFKYDYDEKIFSLYGIVGQQLGKFKYQAGIRLEKAYQIPNLISDSIRIVNDYFNFFPSAHVRYALTEKSEISLSYSKRITRAAAADLNPFTSYADPYNLRRGNPYLQPEFIDSYDLGYTNEIKKVTFTVSLYYRHNTQIISRVKEFYSNNTSAMTFINLDGSHNFGSEAVVIVKPFKWWRNTISANANYFQFVDDNTTANWNVNGISWNAKYSGAVDFWKKTATVQLNVNYNSPRNSIQGRVQRKGPVDLSFEKTFKEGKWSLGCRVTDIFNKMGFYMDLNQPTVQQTSSFKWLTRKYFVTFSYKFGKLEISNKKQGGGEGGFDM
jgi:outer membrane receptor protein involved in Fe transport